MSYIKYGCNRFHAEIPVSTPLGFWTRQDILQYALENQVPYPSCYGEICKKGDLYSLTGEQHTGCVGCLFGIAFDPQRIERLKEKSPSRYRYYMEDLNYRELLPLLISAENYQLSLFGGAL